jgi:hypothetical protein
MKLPFKKISSIQSFLDRLFETCQTLYVGTSPSQNLNLGSLGCGSLSPSAKPNLHWSVRWDVGVYLLRLNPTSIGPSVQKVFDNT